MSNIDNTKKQMKIRSFGINNAKIGKASSLKNGPNVMILQEYIFFDYDNNYLLVALKTWVCGHIMIESYG
jgi:hypothetical protein